MRNFSFKMLMLACFLLVAGQAGAQFRIETNAQNGSEVTVDENGAKSWISHFNTTQAVSTATPNGDGTYTLDKKSFRNRNGYQANVYGRTVADDADSLISNGNRYNMPRYNSGANIMHFASLAALDSMLMGEVANGSTSVLTTNPSTGLFDVAEGDAAFGVSPGKYKKVELAFYLRLGGYEVAEDITFDILTYDAGTNLGGATASYELSVYLGSDGGDAAATVADYYVTGSGVKNVSLAAATGLNVSDFTNQNIYVYLKTTGSGTAIADDVRDPMIVIDNIAAKLVPPIWVAPDVAENQIGNNESAPLTGFSGVETTMEIPIKTTGRWGELKIVDNLYFNGQGFDTFKPLTFLESGALMANDGSGNYTVPVEYTLKPAVQDPGTGKWSKQEIVVSAPADKTDDDMMFYFKVTPRVASSNSARIELDMGTRIWYDIFYAGVNKELIFVRTNNNNWDSTVVAGIKDHGGYNVTEVFQTVVTEDQLPLFNAADIVIMGRSLGSADVASGKDVWDQITSPVLSMNPWGMRNSRALWFNTGTCSNIVSNPDTVLQGEILWDDPVLDGLSGTIDWWNGMFSILAPVDAGNGKTIIQTSDGSPLLTRWAKGVEFYDGSGQIPQGDRSYIGNGNDNTEVVYWGFSDDAKKIFFNELARLSSGEETMIPKKVAYVTLDKEMDASATPVSADPIINMLQADENIDLTVMVVAADADLGDLSVYDAVIAQESFGSSSAIFKPGGSLGMGGIPVPFILNKAYTMRAGRGFADGAAGSGGENGNVKYLSVEAANQANDLFKGLTFVGDSVQVFRSTANDDGSAGGTKALQFATNVEISAANTLLASGTMDPAEATVCINDIPAGATIGSETLQARMIAFSMNFGAISRNAGTNFTDEGLTIWRNAVYSLAGLEVPAEKVMAPAAAPVLKHSYTFEVADTAIDVVAGANGTLTGGMVKDGKFTSAPGGFIELPAADIAINTYPAVTFEIYIAESESAPTNSMAYYLGGSEGNLGGNGTFLATRHWNGPATRAAISTGETATPWTKETAVTDAALDVPGMTHAVVTIDGEALSLYINGELVGSDPLSTMSNTIAALSNDFAWIARGGYGNDPTWLGSISEFNIYENVLSAEQIAENAANWPEDMVTPRKVAYVTLDKEMDASASAVDADPIITLLEADESIELTVMVVAADADLGDLSMYDAVIAQESFGSSSAIFKPGGSLGMGSIPVPFILNKAYTLRGGRGFADGTAGSGGENGNVKYLMVSPENQSNDLFKGLTFAGDSVQVFRATANDNGSAGGTKALQFATDVEISAENTLLASGTMDPANATVCINDIPAGDTIGSEVLQARMLAFSMNFGAISKNQGTNFTDAGLTIWRNAVYSLVGLAVPDEAVEAPAAAPILKHSYTFEVADTAIDVVAGANGSLTGGMVKDGKFVSAPGGYVELPAADIAINTYPAVTFEMYIAESASAPTNSMAFYLGGSPNNLGGNGTFVATNHWNGPATRAAISTGEEATPWTKETAVTAAPLSAPGMTHVVMTIDDEALSLYINGELVGSDALATMSNSIAALSNDFAWIARGGYGGDPTWLGSVSEFNIYENVLSAEQIAENAANWPNDKVDPRMVAYVTLAKDMDGTATAVDADPIIQMLEADENINLTVMVVAADSVLGDLSMYDVVVAQESFGSSSAILKPGGSLGMGSIPVPFLLNKAYTLRGGRGFADGTAGSGGENPNVMSLKVAPENQTNDLFKAISFAGDTVQVFRETANDDGSAGGTKALQFATNVEISAENTLLASGTMDPAEATVCINDIPAGDTIGSEVLQARMIAFSMNFGAISKDYGTNFTSEGLTLWRNAIYSLAGIAAPDTMVQAPAPASIVKPGVLYNIVQKVSDLVIGKGSSDTQPGVVELTNSEAQAFQFVAVDGKMGTYYILNAEGMYLSKKGDNNWTTVYADTINGTKSEWVLNGTDLSSVRLQVVENIDNIGEARSYLSTDAIDAESSLYCDKAGDHANGEFMLQLATINVAVTDVVAGNNVTLYPNPARDFARVEFDMTENATVTLTVYNTLGQKVQVNAPMNLNAGENMMEINTSNLNNGMYIYQLEVGNTTYNGKFYISK